MKGILLAGGKAKRLYPITKGISKHLLAVYDKPMIYYPLSILMLAGIRDIILITNDRNLKNFQELLGNGENFGINISYIIQENANGIAEAFLLSENLIKDDTVCLILGDNIFFGYALSKILKEKISLQNGAEIFAYRVKNPSDYGVVTFDKNQKIINIEEKPKKIQSEYAITGLYFYDKTVIDKAKKLSFSKRGELEITDLNNLYLQENQLKLNLLGRGHSWFDAGNENSLLSAANFIQSIQERQGQYIACLEEIAFLNSWITKDKLLELSKKMKGTNYGKYLEEIWRNSK